MSNTILNEKVLDGTSLVTASSTVKIENSNGYTLQDSYENALTISEIMELFPQCKNFRGSFEWGELTEDFFEKSSKGDFWVNDKTTELQNMHCYLHYPNDVMYYDGVNVVPIHLPRHKKVAEKDHYDICIVGGGAGAMGCAYALKDKGYNVVLIEKLDSLGGTHINGPIPTLISSPITGNWLKEIIEDGYNQGRVSIALNKHQEVGEGTTFDKLWRSSMYTTAENNRGNQFVVPPYWTSQRYFKDLTDGGIEVLLRTEFVSSVFDPLHENKILGINVKNLDSGKEYYIGAEYFVDCSADGVLCRYGKTENTDFYIGTDNKSRFNESAYPDSYVADRYKINCIEGGYRSCNDSYLPGDKKRVENRSRWKKYSDIIYKLNGGADFEGHHVTSTSTGNSIDPHIFIDKGNDVAHSIALPRAMAHFALTHDNVTCFAEQCKMLGIRESYRIKCDKMLTQEDCGKLASSSTIVNNHTIALSSWYADIHNDAGLQGSVTNSWLNEIPYETLIPSAFKNVLVASRCFGCSHIAQSSFRLTRTMMSIGYAAGYALKQCVDRWLEDVRNIDIAQLQSDVGIVELMTEMETYFLNK